MSELHAPLEAVLGAFDLERTGTDAFVGDSLPHLSKRVYGGQVLAQSLIAAARTVADAGLARPRLPHSVHGYFLRSGDLDAPIVFEVERLRDGGSFSARRTHALQHGKPILSMITSFQEDQEGLEHFESPPEVPHPDEVDSILDFLSTTDHPAAAFLHRHAAVDMRHINGHVHVPGFAEPQHHQALWMRPRGVPPTDQLLLRALLTYACDQVILEPVLRRHGLSWTHPGLNVASLDHAMWWHRDVPHDQWWLFVQESPSAQGGRGLGTARVYSESGELIATIAQEGMVRVPPPASDAV